MLCNISFPFSFYGENIKRRLHLSSPIQVSSCLLLHDYGCSFVAELGKKLEKKFFFFFEKIYVFLQNIHFLQKKMFIYGKKSFVMKFFHWKKHFLTEKNYISFQKYIFTQKILVLQIKYESLLNIYSFCKKKLFWS